MAQLGGERPLACVQDIYGCCCCCAHIQANASPTHPAPQDLEQTSLVPAWVKVLCPNATKLELGRDTISPHHVSHAAPHPRIQSLEWTRYWTPEEGPPVAEHVRRELAALPKLDRLVVPNLDWAVGTDEQQARQLISASVTHLELCGDDVGPMEEESRVALLRLGAQFPRLRKLCAGSILQVDDCGLEALLQLPRLERLGVRGVSLRRSHAHRRWPSPRLEVSELDVDSFALLLLDGVERCTPWGAVVPSDAAAAAARVAAAV